MTLHYDSMLAKLIAHAPDRPRAIAVMQRALQELTVVGVATNVPFHRQLLADPAFQRGDIDIQFLERRPDLLAAEDDDATVERLAIAAALLAEDHRLSRRAVVPQGSAVASATAGATAWTQLARRDGLR